MWFMKKKAAEEKLNCGHEEQMPKPAVRISVRNLVEFVLRSGDIDSGLMRGTDAEAALAGARLHRKLQKNQTGIYASEVSLSADIEYEDLLLRIEGRADGIIGGDEPAIDEIKGMYLDVSLLEAPIPVHLAQAKCYAAIYAADQGLDRIGVRMTYASLEREEIRYFRYTYLISEITEWFRQTAGLYYRWAKWQLEHGRARNASMEALTFPFPYREGQKKLTAAVWHAIKDKKELFLMAPTGVGKTMSCVYPAVRAVGNGLGERIFYLTAKNETLAAGREAFSILTANGLDFRTVLITSKEKICPHTKPKCDPESCQYAKGHFDRVNDAVFDLLQNVRFIDRDTLQRQAEKFIVCPFELTLDTASWCDAVLCDYNYVFDPNVQLKRFFGSGAKGEHIFLIDEVHNLVERARDMYSAAIVKEHVLAAKKAVGKSAPKLTRALERVNKILLVKRHECEAEPEIEAAGGIARLMTIEEAEPLVKAVFLLYEELRNFYEKSEEHDVRENLLEFYFEVRDFVFTADCLGDHYVIWGGSTEEAHFAVRLFCVNPAERITAAIDRGRAAVLFSATLLPIDYYKSLLTTRENEPAVYAPSPFNEDNRLILIGRDISTRYRDRSEFMYAKIASYILTAAKTRTGNYLAFFPSYKMLRDVFECFAPLCKEERINWVLQTPGMQEDEREIFLENFYEDPESSLVGFCVMGGMFAEGIDLTGNRLIGAIVVGTGIPQVTCERELLKKYFDQRGNGFDYAYRCPGMNKAEQAAGRVIRTQTDRGVILLLDERFAQAGSRRLFPREWARHEVCTLENAEAKLSTFWRGFDQ